MKDAKIFFYRLDVLKKAVFWISLPIVFITWFIPTNIFIAYGLGIPADILFILSLLPMRVPDDADIIKAVRENYKDYLAAIANERKCTEKELTMLDGFAPTRERLCRRAGSRAIYPVARTVILAEKNGRLDLYQKDAPLLGEGKGEHRLSVSADTPLVATLEKGHYHSVLFTLKNGQGEVSLYLHECHKIRDLLTRYSSYVTLDEESKPLL